MEELDDRNKVVDNSEAPREFKYNFVNTPWCDRSDKSKIGIVVLLVSIFLVIMGLVTNGFILHCSGDFRKNLTAEISCHLDKMENYRYVARIHSVESRELLCLGAVISTSSVVAHHVCVKSGPVRLFLGAISDPHCRKGFAVNLQETVHHEGVIGRKLVILTSYENIKDCSEVIPIGESIDVNANAFIIGRPYMSKKSLSRRPVVVRGNGTCTFNHQQNLSKNYTICVGDYGRCPLRAGDLLVQGGHLFGLASTSLHHNDVNKLASFASLSIVSKDLLEMDVFF